MSLIDYADKGYSQFGEEGIIRRIFEVIGEGNKRCGEVGAGDGLDCSNTARLWKHEGWSAVLAESDVSKIDALHRNTKGYDVEIFGELTTDNINEVFKGDFDLLSIDVDGDDWFLLNALERMPRVLLIEFNQSIPWRMDVRPAEQGSRLGASAMALCKLARSKGLFIVDAIGCNLIFQSTNCVVSHPSTFLSRWSGRENPLTYLATDYDGRPYIIGEPPWGLPDDVRALVGQESLVWDTDYWPAEKNQAMWGIRPSLLVTGPVEDDPIPVASWPPIVPFGDES